MISQRIYIHFGANALVDSEALTKIQAVILIAVIVVAAAGGAAAYTLLSGEEEPLETIKIGICSSTSSWGGRSVVQGAILAAEQVNAEGGVLGRNFTIVEEDDAGGMDSSIAYNAMTKLITVDEADFIINTGGLQIVNTYQEIVADNQKILFHASDPANSLTQKVLDDYDRYRYYFRYAYIKNETANEWLSDRHIVAMREYTGLSKLAILCGDMGVGDSLYSYLFADLDRLGIEVVYDALVPLNTLDYSSYFAQAEAAGAEIIKPMFYSGQNGAVIKEWHNRQSPTVLWGLSTIGMTDAWELTEGKCNSVSFEGQAVAVGYPRTSKVIPFREDYFERWGEEVTVPFIAFAYDIVRFILPDAIERAGTMETDAVIEALENLEIEETSLFKDFAFTSSHDTLFRKGDEDNWDSMKFQWQDGELVPIYPQELMVAAGATYIYPDWPGPWD